VYVDPTWHNPGRVPDKAAVTNADGRYQLALPAGTIKLEAHGRGTTSEPLRGWAYPVVIRAGQQTTADITVAPPGHIAHPEATLHP
jgi:hypothetical protein